MDNAGGESTVRRHGADASANSNNSTVSDRRSVEWMENAREGNNPKEYRTIKLRKQYAEE